MGFITKLLPNYIEFDIIFYDLLLLTRNTVKILIHYKAKTENNIIANLESQK